jgi:hypothetical protein
LLVAGPGCNRVSGSVSATAQPVATAPPSVTNVAVPAPVAAAQNPAKAPPADPQVTLAPAATTFSEAVPKPIPSGPTNTAAPPATTMQIGGECQFGDDCDSMSAMAFCDNADSPGHCELACKTDCDCPSDECGAGHRRSGRGAPRLLLQLRVIRAYASLDAS